MPGIAYHGLPIGNNQRSKIYGTSGLSLWYGDTMLLGLGKQQVSKVFAVVVTCFEAFFLGLDQFRSSMFYAEE